MLTPLVFYIFAILFVIFLALLFWLWWWLAILRPLKKAQYKPAAIPLLTAIAIQISIFTILVALILRPPSIIVAALWPLADLLVPFTFRRSYYGQFADAFSGPLFWAAISFTISLLLMWGLFGRYRKFILLPALVISTVILVYNAEQTSKLKMAAALQNLGGECFVRSPIWVSSRFAGREFQFDLHAVTIVGNDRYGWSYRNMDFYLLSAGDAGRAKLHRCLEQIAPS